MDKVRKEQINMNSQEFGDAFVDGKVPAKKQLRSIVAKGPTKKKKAKTSSHAQSNSKLLGKIRQSKILPQNMEDFDKPVVQKTLSTHTDTATTSSEDNHGSPSSNPTLYTSTCVEQSQSGVEMHQSAECDSQDVLVDKVSKPVEVAFPRRLLRLLSRSNSRAEAGVEKSTAVESNNTEDIKVGTDERVAKKKETTSVQRSFFRLLSRSDSSKVMTKDTVANKSKATGAFDDLDKTTETNKDVEQKEVKEKEGKDFKNDCKDEVSVETGKKLKRMQPRKQKDNGKGIFSNFFSVSRLRDNDDRDVERKEEVKVDIKDEVQQNIQDKTETVILSNSVENRGTSNSTSEELRSDSSEPTCKEEKEKNKKEDKVTGADNNESKDKSDQLPLKPAAQKTPSFLASLRTSMGSFSNSSPRYDPEPRKQRKKSVVKIFSENKTQKAFTLEAEQLQNAIDENFKLIGHLEVVGNVEERENTDREHKNAEHWGEGSIYDIVAKEYDVTKPVVMRRVNSSGSNSHTNSNTLLTWNISDDEGEEEENAFMEEV